MQRTIAREGLDHIDMVGSRWQPPDMHHGLYNVGVKEEEEEEEGEGVVDGGEHEDGIWGGVRYGHDKVDRALGGHWEGGRYHRLRVLAI